MKKYLAFLLLLGSLQAQQVINGSPQFVPGSGPTIQIPNASVTGTTVNKLAKLTGSPSTVVITATTDTGGIKGIVVSGAGVTGLAAIAINGQASLAFDGATTAGDYVQNSPTTAGDGHDAGASCPASGQVLGRVLSTNGSAGTYVISIGPEGCGGAVVGVASFTGDGGLLNNSASTGAVTATLATAGAHKYWGNNTGSTAPPGYDSLVSADIPNNAANTTGNAGTATALAALPTPCSSGQAPLGILANGNSTGCFTPTGGNPLLENCTPDQTGNSFYSVTSLTNWFAGSWQFVPNTTTYINCEVYIPNAQTGATLVLDVYDNDTSGTHTASFQTCDVFSSSTLQVGSLTCAVAQTWTATGTAYARVQLTFNVQSTLSNNGTLIVKIGVAPSGTQPSANLIVYPHFIL